MFLGGLSLGVLAASFAAEAQQTTRRQLVGFLCNTTKLARAFGEGLRELGYVDGRNIFVEYRCAEGRTERGPELAGKRLELLKTVVPEIAELTVLVNPTNPNASRQLRETEAAARSLGVRLKVLRVPSTTEFDKTFSGMGRASATALFISSDGLFFAERRRIAEIALANRMPAMGFAREFAEDGILMAYGASLPALYHRAAVYVDKILKGAKPGDLPVEQPTKFELVINLKTAKALGLTIPHSLLVRADQIIE